MDLLDKIQARQDANELDFGSKPKAKRKSPIKMGAQHAAKITATRAIRDSFGPGLISGIFSLFFDSTRVVILCNISRHHLSFFARTLVRPKGQHYTYF